MIGLKGQAFWSTMRSVLTMYLCLWKGVFFSEVKGNVLHVLINTEDRNMNKYTVKQYSDARKARQIEDIIGSVWSQLHGQYTLAPQKW